jgi:hypothetical protein
MSTWKPWPKAQRMGPNQEVSLILSLVLLDEINGIWLASERVLAARLAQAVGLIAIVLEACFAPSGPCERIL